MLRLFFSSLFILVNLYSTEFDYNSYMPTKLEEVNKTIQQNGRKVDSVNYLQKKMEVEIKVIDFPKVNPTKDDQIIQLNYINDNFDREHSILYDFSIKFKFQDKKYTFFLPNSLLKDFYEYIRKDDKAFFYISYASTGKTSEETYLFIEAFKTEQEKNNSVPQDSALYIATYNGDETKVKELLKDKKTKIDEQNQTGKTALHTAILRNHFGIAKLLINKGASVSILDYKDDSALHFAASKGELDLVKLIIEKEADINKKNYYKLTPILWAAWNGNIEVVEYLHQKKAEINDVTMTKYNLCHLASFSGNVKIVEFCINKKIDKDAKDYLGRTPLIGAVLNHFEEIALFLISKDVKIDTVDKFNDNALMYCGKIGVHDTAQKLVSLGSSLSFKGSFGNTPLHAAVINSEITMVKIFVDLNAPLQLRNSDNKTAMDIAKEKNYFLIETILNK
jgi:ankyrin repeat protein